MPEESMTPDLVDRWRDGFNAINSGDVHAAMSIWGPNPVWDMSPIGLGVYEGASAIRGFWEDWVGTYEDWQAEPEEMVDLGSGVTLAVVLQKGRVAGSSGDIRLRYASVAVWAGALIVLITSYSDVKEARAAAERLAEERG
jgi:ketosteroid isomerase-like protein